MHEGEREVLISALRRLGDGSALARWLAGVHQGLASGSTAVDPGAWSSAAGSYPAPVRDGHTLSSRAEEEARRAYENPDDPAPRLELAEATLKLAFESRQTYATRPALARRFEKQLHADAKRAGLEAERLGATGWRLDTVLGLVAYYTGDTDEAYARAERAMKELPPGQTNWASMAIVTVFAEARWQEIKRLVRENKDWPAGHLADLHAAYSVLRQHPLGTDDQVVWHYELLMWLGARQKALGVLYDGLERFRDSSALHERLRTRVLDRRGPLGLEEAYARMLEKRDDPARLAAYAGLASIEAAEQYRREQKYDKALAAYGRAVDYYEQAVAAHPAHQEGADLAIALAMAGRARVSYQRGADASALEDVLASFARSPDTAGTRDGMGITPGETAQMLLARLKASGKTDAAARLEGALSKIDPELLIPDR
jgi:tetratricopeptide (TPR) repeat protein